MVNTNATTQPPAPVSVSFEPQAFSLLQGLANRQGKTISQTLRDALALQNYFLDVKLNGGKILIQQNGITNELISV